MSGLPITPPATRIRPDMRRPWNPYLVLALAVVLPGAGHVALGQQIRGFGFAFFTLLLALLTWHIAPADRSIIGRTAGGLFVWALSIPDAYRIARLRWTMWRQAA
jgi:hypothetical protein